jgi:hypothetical protein
MEVDRERLSLNVTSTTGAHFAVYLLVAMTYFPGSLFIIQI